MYKIRLELVGNPTVYRIVHVKPQQTMVELDATIETCFGLSGDSTYFEAKKCNGKRTNWRICTDPIESDEADGLETTVADWLVKVGDHCIYYVEDLYEVHVKLEAITQQAITADKCVEGKGSLVSSKQRINLNEINEMLEMKYRLFELSNEALNEIADDVLETFEDEEKQEALIAYVMDSYKEMLEAATELKKLKPWQYFKEDDIIAVEIEDIEETYFISVLGATKAEYGFMAYQSRSYDLMVDLLVHDKVIEDSYIDQTGISVCFVNRDELEKIDYTLIKDCGMSFRGKHEWLQFRSFNAGESPTLPFGEDVEIMTILLQGMIAFTKKRIAGLELYEVPLHHYNALSLSYDGNIEHYSVIGYEPPPKETVVIPMNDIERQKLKRRKVSAQQVEFDLFYLPTLLESEEEGKYLYPLSYTLIDHETGMVLAQDVLPLPRDEFTIQVAFWEMMMQLAEKPSVVLVREDVASYIQLLAKHIAVTITVGELVYTDELKRCINRSAL